MAQVLMELFAPLLSGVNDSIGVVLCNWKWSLGRGHSLLPGSGSYVTWDSLESQESSDGAFHPG